jgi:ABC-type uncharacterized transport system permease subunit
VSDLTPEDSEAQEELQEAPPPLGPGDYAPSVAERLALFQRAGGVVVPLITTVFALLMGGIVIAASAPSHNPFSAAKGIFNGTGLNWLFPWVHGMERTNAAFNLQQTLLLTTSLILTGLAVAFAFRCGLFNIGGNGQYLVGGVISVWVGSSFVRMNPALHMILAIVLAVGAGAVWAAIAGFLKATRGVHEVISTIMLNWIAVWLGSWAFGQAGPLQNKVQITVPISNDIAPGAHLPVFWGSPVLSGLDVGFFIALFMPIVFWVLLNRTTLGYEVRAVGFNPEAARYGGINVKRSYVAAMAISGGFAGLAAAVDILGWQFRLGQLDVPLVNAGFIGIAVALLGRNSAIGIPFGALLFAGLVQGTSTRNPAIQDVLPTQLAGNLTYMIMGLVLLFIGADVLILYIWQARKKLRLRPKPAALAEGPA